ncbi:MAG TPA: hypothetical protein VLH40_01005 [Atribacteraceae bacterium]|nr:hypothetical protein [Atribacteraceae bacterium]
MTAAPISPARSSRGWVSGSDFRLVACLTQRSDAGRAMVIRWVVPGILGIAGEYGLLARELSGERSRL